MSEPVFEFRGVGKSFFQTRALSEVSLPIAAGEVLGLVGENGAGKSTLMNILGGVLPPDSGEMFLAGAPYLPRTPLEAAGLGIALVHQELNLFPNLSIAENLFLTELPTWRPLGVPWIHRRELHARAAEVLKTVGLDAEPATLVSSLSPGERQLVEIAKAVRTSPRVIVFDEPTTSLGKGQAERLFEIIARLRSQGTAVVYISHNLGDVLRLSQRVAVLRDGRVQAHRPAREFTVDEMISLMVGRSLQNLFPKRTHTRGETVLEVRGVSQSGVVRDISFSLHRGEILGVSGLMGSGRTELARMLFGMDPFEQGEIRVHGLPVGRPNPRRSIKRKIGFLTEDRRGEGILGEASIEDNVALVSLSDYAGPPLGLIRQNAIRRRVQEIVGSLGLQYASLQKQPAKTLSGGNQQKVVLAKWLISGAEVLILDEPTRGVDVGAKADIYAQICRLVADGAAVLLISSEIEELVGLCDRILIMTEGEIRAIVDREGFDRDEMLRSAFGESRLK
ncbi:MAG: sugar ABC transporter ATP-binding protein [Planctomycetota bacterium]